MNAGTQKGKTMNASHIRACSYVYTTRLVYGEPNLPTGSRVWVRQKSGTKRTGIRYQVVVDRPGVEDCSDCPARLLG